MVTRPSVGLYSALVNVTVHFPSFVMQEALGGVDPSEIFAPSVIKLMAVPSGTELPRRSDATIVNVDVSPSYCQPSIL